MKLLQLSLLALEDNPYQPRSSIDEQDITQLASSIAAVGLLQPPLVHEYEPDHYLIVAGHRRVQACRQLQMQMIPVWVIEAADPAHLAKASLVENLQRQDLNAMEIARALQRLQKEFQFSHEQIAYAMSKKRSSISNYLRLLQLSPKLQQAVEDKKISFGHAKSLACLSPVEQEKWLDLIVKKHISVHGLEKALESVPKTSSREKLIQPECEAIEQALIQRFGLHSYIHVEKSGKGWVKVHFKELKDLQELAGSWDL